MYSYILVETETNHQLGQLSHHVDPLSQHGKWPFGPRPHGTSLPLQPQLNMC